MRDPFVLAGTLTHQTVKTGGLFLTIPKQLLPVFTYVTAAVTSIFLFLPFVMLACHVINQLQSKK